ncbi:MAG: phage tail protein [Sphingomonas sp. 28-66-16]|nr:MAG: phage tail protein [Sphingomonas sp. 28-66-16]
MSQPFIGEIRLFPWARGAPIGWSLCNGALLAISEYDALYNLIGTTYGGDGQSTFAVPDMRGRVPIHQGTGRGLSTYVLGQMAGTDQVTLISSQLPSHTHFPAASTTPGTSDTPTGNVPSVVPGSAFYGQMNDGAPPYPLPTTTIQPSGGSQAHDNSAPTLALNYCISLFGIYPQQP